ncbi:hypothetical protein [Bradyrhizobium sp.]|uniref:hypothetical protein n=1 Tax=Bradyrhizobium sp. TaxID=376 RepID=UPI004037FD99
MTQRTTLLASAAVIAAIALLPVARAATEPKEAAPSAATEATDQALVDMKALTEQSTRFKADAEAALKVLDEKQGILDTLLKDTKGARQFTDDMVRLLQATADRLAPNAPYMTTLQAQLEIVRALSRNAQASTDPANRPFAETFDRQAGQIAAIIAEARDLGTRLVAQVETMKLSRDRIGFAYAAAKTDAFIQAAREYLDTARGVLSGATDLANRANTINSPAVPTQ